MHARIVGGQIAMSWDAPARDEDIASYRMYYSHASILKNDGRYDDFETTPAPATSYVFTSPIREGTLYISVLAVDNNGEESPSFTEETLITLPASLPAAALPTMPPSPPVTLPPHPSNETSGLPGSGPGLELCIGLAGAGAMWWKMQRR